MAPGIDTRTLDPSPALGPECCAAGSQEPEVESLRGAASVAGGPDTRALQRTSRVVGRRPGGGATLFSVRWKAGDSTGGVPVRARRFARLLALIAVAAFAWRAAYTVTVTNELPDPW